MTYREDLPTELDILLTTYGMVTMHRDVKDEDIDIPGREIVFALDGKRFVFSLRELLQGEDILCTHGLDPALIYPRVGFWIW